MRARYKNPADQMARLKRDATKYAKSHAKLISKVDDTRKIKTSRNLFRAKIYNERLSSENFDEIMDLFEELVGQNLDHLLNELHGTVKE